MKTLTRCALVLALALVVVPAVQAAQPAPAAPVAQVAVATAPASQVAVDAPVVEMMAPNQQPVFANLQQSVGAATPCIDSGIHCNSTSECYTNPIVACGNLPCYCNWNGTDFTCQACF
jgi:hypothetical protein